MKEPTIKQFKMTNDDEIICEVVSSESGDAGLVVRSCMKIMVVEDFQRGVRFYAFRPWFSFVDDPSELHILNSNQVIGEANPSDNMLSHYARSILGMKHEKNRTDFSFDQIAEKMGMDIDNITDEDFDDFLDSMNSPDSDNNVIKFPTGKTTLH